MKSTLLTGLFLYLAATQFGVETPRHTPPEATATPVAASVVPNLILAAAHNPSAMPALPAQFAQLSGALHVLGPQAYGHSDTLYRVRTLRTQGPSVN